MRGSLCMHWWLPRAAFSLQIHYPGLTRSIHQHTHTLLTQHPQIRTFGGGLGRAMTFTRTQLTASYGPVDTISFRLFFWLQYISMFWFLITSWNTVASFFFHVLCKAIFIWLKRQQFLCLGTRNWFVTENVCKYIYISLRWQGPEL